VIVAITWDIFFWCGKGKVFCERPFALHPQQLGRDEQNPDVAPPGKILWMLMF